jgi:hypothetical protein
MEVIRMQCFSHPLLALPSMEGKPVSIPTEKPEELEI